MSLAQVVMLWRCWQRRGSRVWRQWSVYRVDWRAAGLLLLTTVRMSSDLADRSRNVYFSAEMRWHADDLLLRWRRSTQSRPLMWSEADRLHVKVTPRIFRNSVGWLHFVSDQSCFLQVCQRLSLSIYNNVWVFDPGLGLEHWVFANIH